MSANQLPPNNLQRDGGIRPSNDQGDEDEDPDLPMFGSKPNASAAAAASQSPNNSSNDLSSKSVEDGSPKLSPNFPPKIIDFSKKVDADVK